MPRMDRLSALLQSLCLALVVTLAACSSLTSYVEGPSDPVGDGVIYYMPQRPIKVSITFPPATPATPATPVPGTGSSPPTPATPVPGTGSSPPTPAPPGSPAAVPRGVPSVDTISATADRRQRFVLRFSSNWIGKNHAHIGVNPHGLLTMSNADTTSGISAIVQNIAKALGYATALAAAAPSTATPPIPQCASGRTYTVLIDNLSAGHSVCGFSISVTNLDGSSIDTTTPPPDTKRLKPDSSHAGIFYKQEIPYLVNVKDPGGQSSQFIAFSPNLSPVAFVPITKSFFANNQTNIALSEGIVSSVDSMTTGELVALTELPANFISAYTAAIGQLFTTFGNNTQAQTTLINNQNALAIAKIKQTACSSTIDAYKATLDPANLAGPNGPALPAAFANINTALTNIQAACK